MRWLGALFPDRPRRARGAHTSESCGGCAPPAARRDAVQAIHISSRWTAPSCVAPHVVCSAHVQLQCTDSWLGGVVVEEELCGMR